MEDEEDEDEDDGFVYILNDVATYHNVTLHISEGLKYAELPPSIKKKEKEKNQVEVVEEEEQLYSSSKATTTSNEKGVLDMGYQFGEDDKNPEIKKYTTKTKTTTKKQQHRNTLYVTHIREPISRLISHYKYEIRWSCPLQLEYMIKTDTIDLDTNNHTVTTNTTSTSNNNDSYSDSSYTFVPTHNNIMVNFNEFINFNVELCLLKQNIRVLIGTCFRHLF